MSSDRVTATRRSERSPRFDQSGTDSEPELPRGPRIVIYFSDPRLQSIRRRPRLTVTPRMPSDDSWLLDSSEIDGHSTDVSPLDTPDQFDLVCDNVRLDVASRRSPLADLGRMLQAVLGLAIAATHRSKDRVL